MLDIIHEDAPLRKEFSKLYLFYLEKGVGGGLRVDGFQATQLALHRIEGTHLVETIKTKMANPNKYSWVGRRMRGGGQLVRDLEGS